MVEAATKHKIDEYMRKHRASGGKAESPEKGDDDAEKDLKMKPEDRSAPNKVAPEAEEMKAKKGGRVKRKEGGKCEGMEAHHHAGRKRRASGGAAENSPFTTALKSTQPKGRSTEKETQGYDH